MKAFHNDTEIKAKYLGRVKIHAELDEIVKGKYWENGKGCAVGCTIHGDSHKKYETELGIPEWLARVEDTIFEGLPLERAKLWPMEFLEAINVGCDLEKAKTPFVICVLESTLKSMAECEYDEAKNPEVKKVIDGSIKVVLQMIEAQKTGVGLDSAYSAAYSAAYLAHSAARSAAYSARSAAYSARSAADSARSAADSAADSAARSAADSAARSAADSAAYSAHSAADSAADSARSAAYSAFIYFADSLLKIIRDIV